MTQSEVARLMATIDLEYQSAWSALHGPTLGTSKHDFIDARFKNIDHAREDLESIVGSKKASELFEQWIKAQEEPCKKTEYL